MNVKSYLQNHWKISRGGLAIVVGALAIGVYLLEGGYNVAADEPHSALVFRLVEMTRVNSVSLRARDIRTPRNFGSDAQVKAGASEYAEMCAECHLAPGMEPTEISQGLYPQAPDLMRDDTLSASEQFWVVKHGIKMSGMPAWGKTHSDGILWSIVAFLQKLPTLSPEQYRDMTKNAAEDHNKMNDMPGMSR